MKKQGKIKYIGFSFHDDAQFLDKVLTEHPEMDFVQLQLNYLDWENGVIQSRQNYEVARKHQKPIVVMEPIKGGSLANLPKDIAQKFLDYNPDASISSWALRYVASLSNVKVVLSGMSTYDQVLDNLKTFENFEYLNKKLNATILMVTHDAFTASYADRILFIKDGKIFNEIIKGNSSRKDFFEKIIEVVTLLGGELNDVI